MTHFSCRFLLQTISALSPDEIGKSNFRKKFSCSKEIVFLNNVEDRLFYMFNWAARGTERVYRPKTTIKPCIKQIKGAVLVGLCSFRHRWYKKKWSMSLKDYQTPKHCTEIYNIMKKDFTVLESYHGGNHFMLRCYNHEVSSRKMVFMLQSILNRNVRLHVKMSCEEGEFFNTGLKSV